MAGAEDRLERLERVDLFALQQVADGMRETNTNLRALTEQVTHLGREVSALTAQNLKGEIDDLQRRLQFLEERSQQTQGGVNLWNWCVQQLPWVVAFLALAFSYFDLKDKVHDHIH